MNDKIAIDMRGGWVRAWDHHPGGLAWIPRWESNPFVVERDPPDDSKVLAVGDLVPVRNSQHHLSDGTYRLTAVSVNGLQAMLLARAAWEPPDTTV